MKSDAGTLTWDLWIDFQAQDEGGLTPALVEHARLGVDVTAGRYLLVGSDDSELAVARIVSVDPDGVVQTACFRALPPNTSTSSARRAPPEILPRAVDDTDPEDRGSGRTLDTLVDRRTVLHEG